MGTSGGINVYDEDDQLLVSIQAHSDGNMLAFFVADFIAGKKIVRGISNEFDFNGMGDLAARLIAALKNVNYLNERVYNLPPRPGNIYIVQNGATGNYLTNIKFQGLDRLPNLQVLHGDDWDDPYFDSTVSNSHALMQGAETFAAPKLSGPQQEIMDDIDRNASEALARGIEPGAESGEGYCYFQCGPYKWGTHLLPSLRALVKKGLVDAYPNRGGRYHFKGPPATYIDRDGCPYALFRRGDERLYQFDVSESMTGKVEILATSDQEAQREVLQAVQRHGLRSVHTDSLGRLSRDISVGDITEGHFAESFGVEGEWEGLWVVESEWTTYVCSNSNKIKNALAFNDAFIEEYRPDLDMPKNWEEGGMEWLGDWVRDNTLETVAREMGFSVRRVPKDAMISAYGRELYIMEAESFEASMRPEQELKRDSCCCGATKSNPCACMIQGVMQCDATCPCSLAKKNAESFASECEDCGVDIDAIFTCDCCEREFCEDCLDNSGDHSPYRGSIDDNWCLIVQHPRIEETDTGSSWSGGAICGECAAEIEYELDELPEVSMNLSAETKLKGKVKTISGKPHVPRELVRDKDITPEEAAKRKSLQSQSAEWYKRVSPLNPNQFYYSRGNRPEYTPEDIKHGAYGNRLGRDGTYNEQLNARGKGFDNITGQTIALPNELYNEFNMKSTESSIIPAVLITALLGIGLVAAFKN